MEGLTVVFDAKERKKGKPTSSSQPIPPRKSEKQKITGNANRGLRSHCPHYSPPMDYACTGPCNPADLSSDSSDTDDSVKLPNSHSARSGNVNNSNRNTMMKKKKTAAVNRPSKLSNQSLPKVGVHGWFDDDDDDDDDSDGEDVTPRNSRESCGKPKKAPRNHSKRLSENTSTHRHSNTPICPVPRPGRVPAFDNYLGGEKGEGTNRPSKSSNWSLPEVGVHGWFNDDADNDDGDDDDYDIVPHNSRESRRMPKKTRRNNSKRSSENNNMHYPSNTPICHVPRPGRVPAFDNYPGGAIETWNEGSIDGNGRRQNAMMQTSDHLMSSNMNMKKEENRKQNQQLVSICAKVARFSLLGF